MPASAQIVTLSSAADPSGSFTVSGVFWLTAPANSIVPKPGFVSAVPNILPGDLAALQSGQIVEVAFTAPRSPNFSYPPATTQATVDADIAALFAAAQASLNSANPGLSTAVQRAFNGAAWAPYAGKSGPQPIGVPPIIASPLYVAVAQGIVPNVSTGRAFGYVVAATTVATKVLATTYAPAAPGVGAQRSVSSASASDAAAGTGARTVTITYLTTAFVVKQETLALNGTTAVNTVNTDIAYVESIVVATSGTGATNAGIVTLFAATAGGGGTLATIAAGDGQTNWAHHYVAAGKTCLVISLTAGATLAAGRSFLTRTGDPSQTNLPSIPVGGQLVHAAGGLADHLFQVPVAVKGPDRIFLTEFPNAAVASSVAVGSFEFVEF